jgi:hypothetical protein
VKTHLQLKINNKNKIIKDPRQALGNVRPRNADAKPMMDLVLVAHALSRLFKIKQRWRNE